MAPVERETEAELRRPVRPGLMLRGVEPEVAAAVLAEPSTPRLQPRFARCCETQPQRSRAAVKPSGAGCGCLAGLKY